MSVLITYLSATPAVASHLGAATGRVLSAAAPVTDRVVADPSTANLRGWLRDNVVQLLFLLLGISMLFAGYRGAASKVMMTAGLSLVGLLWIGMAASNNTDTVSRWLMNMVGVA